MKKSRKTLKEQSSSILKKIRDDVVDLMLDYGANDDSIAAVEHYFEIKFGLLPSVEDLPN